MKNNEQHEKVTNADEKEGNAKECMEGKAKQEKARKNNEKQ